MSVWQIFMIETFAPAGGAGIDIFAVGMNKRETRRVSGAGLGVILIKQREGSIITVQKKSLVI